MTLLDVAGQSRARALLCTPSGRMLYSAEGGTLTVIDMYDESAQPPAYYDANMQALDGNKRFDLGSMGVLASKMVLDPAAADPPVGGGADWIYVAGGRDGLWAVAADSRPGMPNPAVRLDDSGDGNPATQKSRRWCTDVALMTVAGQEYLLATFAKKDSSRLRVYDLVAVRAATAAQSELGNEIAPLIDVVLNRNAGLPPIPPLKYPNPGYQFGGALAMAIAVDQQGSAGSETADVYVAMGHDGLVKVDFWDVGGALSHSKEWGPVFGLGTPYEATMTPPPGKSQDLYGNLILEQVRDYLPGFSKPVREERPFFTDVAVLNTTIDGHGAHHLYVSVDHLYWLAFDLDQPWSSSQPILFHAGKQFSRYVRTHGGNKAQEKSYFVGADPNQSGPSCARTIEVVDDSQGAYVIVGNSKYYFLDDYTDTHVDGTAYDADLYWGGGPFNTIEPVQDCWVYQVEWDSAAGSFAWNAEGKFDAGGENVCAPTLQELLPTQLKFFYQMDTDPDPEKRDVGVGMALFDVDGVPPLSNTYLTRDHTRIVGKQCFSAGASPAYPDLIMTTHNDGGVPNSGLLQIKQNGAGQWVLENHYTPEPGTTSDDRGPGGLLWYHPGSATLDEAPDKLWFTSGATTDTPFGNNEEHWLGNRWGYVKLQNLSNYPAIARESWWYLTPPADRFQSYGRVYYQACDLLSGLTQLGAANKPMVGTHIRTAEGLTWFSRVAVDAYIAQNTPANNTTLRLGTELMSFKSLVTHPEFNWMPNGDLAARDFWQSPNNHDDETSLAGTNNPIVIDVPDPTDGWNTVHRVLAVPCRRLVANPDWAIYDSHSDWLPPSGSILRDWFGHGLVQFWELTVDGGGNYDPVVTSENGVDNNTTLGRIIFPDGKQNSDYYSAAFVLESIRIGQDVYLFATDVGGHLYVYDITDILSKTDPSVIAYPTPLASWTTKGSTMDDLPTALMDIAVDYEGGASALIYLAERRVGFEVLRFDPTKNKILKRVSTVQTPGETQGVSITQLASGEKFLVVADYSGGIRLYGH